MEKEKEAFQDAVQIALAEAKKTGKRYFILFPYIANPGVPSICHLIVPLLHEDAATGREREDIAFTVYPNGSITWGEVAADKATENILSRFGSMDHGGM